RAKSPTDAAVPATGAPGPPARVATAQAVSSQVSATPAAASDARAGPRARAVPGATTTTGAGADRSLRRDGTPSTSRPSAASAAVRVAPSTAAAPAAPGTSSGVPGRTTARTVTRPP